jgi:hypothetical protein
MPPRPQVTLLKQLCTNPETSTKAEALVHIAKAKTGAGSGHDLGAGATGLPAICALVASLQSVPTTTTTLSGLTHLLG